MSLKGRQGTAI